METCSEIGFYFMELLNCSLRIIIFHPALYRVDILSIFFDFDLWEIERLFIQGTYPIRGFKVCKVAFIEQILGNSHDLPAKT